MLFQSRFHEPIRRGEITCTVRIWKQLRVTKGKRYRLGSGWIQIDRIQESDVASLTPALARKCGFLSLVDLLKVAQHGSGTRVFVIDFHYLDSAGDVTARLSALKLDEIERKLDAMDRRSGHPWTHATLRIIGREPGRRATDLAADLGRERDEFKRDVRKLKALGLTRSLEIGYELTMLGKEIIRRAEPPRAPR